jgi:hypothetical protein
MDPLTIVLIFAALKQAREFERVDQRIRQALYFGTVAARERYRQSVLAERTPRPESHLSPAEEAAHQKAEADRSLITPAQLQRLRKQSVKLATEDLPSAQVADSELEAISENHNTRDVLSLVVQATSRPFSCKEGSVLNGLKLLMWRRKSFRKTFWTSSRKPVARAGRSAANAR